MTGIAVQDVAKYILVQVDVPVTTMKLQKLAYYSHAWHLAWTGKPLVRERFQAWRNGPVCYPLFELHRGKLMISASEFHAGNASAVSGKAKQTVDAVLQAYGHLSGAQLSALTHGEAPWRDARADVDDTLNSSAPISDDVLRSFYRQLSESGTEIDKLEWLKTV